MVSWRRRTAYVTSKALQERTIACSTSSKLTISADALRMHLRKSEGEVWSESSRLVCFLLRHVAPSSPPPLPRALSPHFPPSLSSLQFYPSLALSLSCFRPAPIVTYLVPFISASRTLHADSPGREASKSAARLSRYNPPTFSTLLES